MRGKVGHRAALGTRGRRRGRSGDFDERSRLLTGEQGNVLCGSMVDLAGAPYVLQRVPPADLARRRRTDRRGPT